MSEPMTDDLSRFIDEAEDYFRSVDDGTLNAAHDQSSLLSEVRHTLPILRWFVKEIRRLKEENERLKCDYVHADEVIRQKAKDYEQARELLDKASIFFSSIEQGCGPIVAHKSWYEFYEEIRAFLDGEKHAEES